MTVGEAHAQNSFYYSGANRQSAPAAQPRPAMSPNMADGYYGNAPYYANQPAPRGYAVRAAGDMPTAGAPATFTPAPDATPIAITSNRTPARSSGNQAAPAGVHRMSPETVAKARAGASAAEPTAPVAKKAAKSSDGPALVSGNASADPNSGFGIRPAQYEAPAPRTSRKVIRSQPTGGSTAPMSDDDLPMLEPVLPDPTRGAPDDEAPDPSSVATDRVKRPFNCPLPNDFKKMNEITDDVVATGDLFPEECGLGDNPYAPRTWQSLTYQWKASALCHRPLLFEEVALERYGHSRFPILQPVISGAFFLGSVPMMPYSYGLEGPRECIYALGYYRPGSCAPYLRYRLPITARAVAFETAAVAGLIGFLP